MTKFVLMLFIFWPASSSVTRIGEYDTREACLAEAKKAQSIAAEMSLARADSRSPIAPEIRASCDIVIPAGK